MGGGGDGRKKRSMNSFRSQPISQEISRVLLTWYADVVSRLNWWQIMQEYLLGVAII